MVRGVEITQTNFWASRRFSEQCQPGHPQSCENHLACWTQGSRTKPFGEVYFFKKGDDYLLWVEYKNVLWGMVFITLSYVLNHFIRNKAFLSKTAAAPRLRGCGGVCVPVPQPRPGLGAWTRAVWRRLAAAPGVAAGPRVGQVPQTGVQPPGPEAWAAGPQESPASPLLALHPAPTPAATRACPHPPSWTQKV